MEDLQAEELDEEFRRGLVSVRPYIERLASPEDGKLCRQWLERLHGWEGDRAERNRLLLDLVAHVRSGLLGRPFTTSPGMEHQNELVGATYERVLDAYSCNSCPDSECPESILPSHRKKTGRLREEAELGRRVSEPPSLSQWTRLNQTSDNELIACPSAVMGDVDQVQSLQNTISSLQAQNEALSHEVELYKKTCQKTQNNFSKVNEELISLKAKLREAERARRTVEGKALDGYKRALEEGLSDLGSQIKEAAEHNFTQLIAALAPHTQENQLKQEIEELKNKLAAERIKSQSKIKKLESVIATKNEQLEKVDKQVKKQCTEMQQEVSHIKSEIDQVATEGQQQLRAKILSLKQDVSRLEKANKKLVAEYEQRLEEFQKDRNQKKGGTIMTSGNRGDMGHLEKTVVELEERYKKIVADIETRAAGQRRRDLQRIQELEEKLINKETEISGGCRMQVK